MFTGKANGIFDSVIADYHIYNNIDHPVENPYESTSIDHLLYAKCWIDTVQWHLEDIIRDPNIDPAEALRIKRRIDASNQERTDMVEYIDTYMMELYRDVPTLEQAKLNTETPAWAIDRLSILALKIYHMNEQAQRQDTDLEHRTQCGDKLKVLLVQREDLSTAIEELLADIAAGRKYMKTYKQMKMYNDPSLNPILYNKGK